MDVVMSVVMSIALIFFAVVGVGAFFMCFEKREKPLFVRVLAFAFGAAMVGTVAEVLWGLYV